eukprot:TRINITY_DN25775_c0_g1_i1.p1 TRINITY_DN25775_c0_g1~~TRINITY_DN25775_c0_g1_i1.p1  ORF type:complete len:181 (+),score=34.81 TRINITY_DN25775_c0_g1_i1:224-766(+)
MANERFCGANWAAPNASRGCSAAYKDDVAGVATEPPTCLARAEEVVDATRRLAARRAAAARDASAPRSRSTGGAPLARSAAWALSGGSYASIARSVGERKIGGCVPGLAAACAPLLAIIAAAPCNLKTIREDEVLGTLTKDVEDQHGSTSRSSTPMFIPGIQDHVTGPTTAGAKAAAAKK